ncbi:hypothetical protein [Paraburkholderia phenoliruptrix]|nr:hypothetical protein [Paraburkholderia phenoliruptrix]WMY10132.1 hypothetical protein P3F88_25765 [Paraburkholderia phenoliruptrix]
MTTPSQNLRAFFDSGAAIIKPPVIIIEKTAVFFSTPLNGSQAAWR